MLPAASRGAGRGWALGAVAREASAGRRDGPPPCCSSVSRETLPTASRAPAVANHLGRRYARRRWAGATVRLRVARAFHVKRCRRRPERRPRPTLGGDGTRGIGGPARRSAFVLPRAFHVKRCRRPPGRRPRPRHEALSTEASSPGKTGHQVVGTRHPRPGAAVRVRSARGVSRETVLSRRRPVPGPTAPTGEAQAR
jgi:hypothetical protein